MSPTSYQTAPPRDRCGKPREGRDYRRRIPRRQGPITTAPRRACISPSRLARFGLRPARMTSPSLLSLLLLLGSLAAPAAVLPGFSVERLGAPSGFPTSVAVDSHGTIYYTTTAGDLFRFVDGQSIAVAHLPTQANGDSGLLGMALRDDATAVVHYT